MTPISRALLLLHFQAVLCTAWTIPNTCRRTATGRTTVDINNCTVESLVFWGVGTVRLVSVKQLKYPPLCRGIES